MLLGTFGRDEGTSLTPSVYVVPAALGVFVEGLIVEIAKFTVCPVQSPTEFETPPAT